MAGDMYSNFRMIEVGKDHPGLDHIANIFEGFKATGVILAACKLEVFDKLHDFGKPVTVQEVVEQTKWPEQATERLFNALVSLKLLDKNETGGHYTYSKCSAADYLRKSVPGSKWSAHSILPDFLTAYLDIPKLFLEGNKNESATNSEEQTDDSAKKETDHGCGQTDEDLVAFYSFLDSMTLPYMPEFIKTIDLSGYRSFVDIAAGSGVVGLEVARQFPHMQVTLTELPGSASLLRNTYIPRSGCSNVKILEGDSFKDPLPEADVYSVGNFVRHWDAEQMDLMMTKLYKSINPGGKLIIFEKCLSDKKDGPPLSTLLDIFMLSHGSTIRTFQEYKAIVEKYGFVDCKIVAIHNSEYDAVHCKKPQ